MSPQVTPWYDVLLVIGVTAAVPAGLLALFYLYVRAFEE